MRSVALEHVVIYGIDLDHNHTMMSHSDGVYEGVETLLSWIEADSGPGTVEGELVGSCMSHKRHRRVLTCKFFSVASWVLI